MKERMLEHAVQLGAAVGLLWMANYAVSKKTRQEIIDRDEGKSQMRHYDEERGWHTDVDHCEDNGEGCTNLHVHHIKPQRTGGSDDETNLITLYECQHTGRCRDEKIKKGYYRE